MEEVVEMAEHYQRDRRELVTTTWERVTCLRPKPTGLLSTEIAHPHLVYIPESRDHASYLRRTKLFIHGWPISPRSSLRALTASR